MTNWICKLGLAAAVSLASLSSHAYMITEGAFTGTDVGGVDGLVATQSGPFTGGSGNPSGEEAWANDNLADTVTFVTKTETVALYATDDADIFAFQLAGDPDYFIVKNAVARALYSNAIDTGWGVIDVSMLGSGFNLPAMTISHVSEFDGEEPCCGGPTDVPVPAPLALIGIGLLGLGLRKKRA